MAKKLTCPEIAFVQGREYVVTSIQRLKMYANAATPEYAPGSFIKLHGTPANGYVPVATSDQGSADYVILAIEDAAGKRLPFQYVAAGSTTQYYVIGIPIGNVVFRITEDAAGTPITDANSGAVAKTYCSLVVGAMADAGPTADRLVGASTPSILLDSSAVNTTAGSLLMQLMGLDPSADNAPYSSTAGASPRTFLARVRDDLAGALQ